MKRIDQATGEDISARFEKPRPQAPTTLCRHAIDRLTL
jgi:hypothetical protein